MLNFLARKLEYDGGSDADRRCTMLRIVRFFKKTNTQIPEQIKNTISKLLGEGLLGVLSVPGGLRKGSPQGDRVGPEGRKM